MGMVVASVVVMFWGAMIVVAFVISVPVLVLVIAVSLLRTGADQAGGNELHPALRQRSAELLVTSGCIGHTKLVSAGAEVGSSLIPHFGHLSGSWLTTSGCMGHA